MADPDAARRDPFEHDRADQPQGRCGQDDEHVRDREPALEPPQAASDRGGRQPRLRHPRAARPRPPALERSLADLLDDADQLNSAAELGAVRLAAPDRAARARRAARSRAHREPRARSLRRARRVPVLLLRGRPARSRHRRRRPARPLRDPARRPGRARHHARVGDGDRRARSALTAPARPHDRRAQQVAARCRGRARRSRSASAPSTCTARSRSPTTSNSRRCSTSAPTASTPSSARRGSRSSGWASPSPSSSCSDGRTGNPSGMGKLLHLSDVPGTALADARWQPLNERLGIRAFGINAVQVEPGGDADIEHDETHSGHQEVYSSSAAARRSGWVTRTSRPVPVTWSRSPTRRRPATTARWRRAP